MNSIYDDLGVRPVINAYGNRTILGGSTPSATVRAAMDASEEYYVHMDELMDTLGEKIADMLGIEAVLITNGAAAALSMAAAACITGEDLERIERIPDVTGMPHEIIIQRQLRLRYDRFMTVAGGKLVEVGDEDETRPEHIEAAIGPGTVAIHCLPETYGRRGALPLEKVIPIAKAHDIPIIVDAAGSVYPTENLSKYVKMGADLVAYGAKYFGSVQSSGLLTGRKDLIAAARLNSWQHFEATLVYGTPVNTFGRPMKMDRQDVVAVYAALREWLTMNHEDRFASYEPRIAQVKEALREVPAIEVVALKEQGPPTGVGVKVDPATGKTASEVVEEFRAGNPSIWIGLNADGGSFSIRVPLLNNGGEKVIARRLREVLSSGRKKA